MVGSVFGGHCHRSDRGHRGGGSSMRPVRQETSRGEAKVGRMRNDVRGQRKEREVRCQQVAGSIRHNEHDDRLETNDDDGNEDPSGCAQSYVDQVGEIYTMSDDVFGDGDDESLVLMFDCCMVPMTVVCYSNVSLD